MPTLWQSILEVKACLRLPLIGVAPSVATVGHDKSCEVHHPPGISVLIEEKGTYLRVTTLDMGRESSVEADGPDASVSPWWSTW